MYRGACRSFVSTEFRSVRIVPAVMRHHHHPTGGAKFIAQNQSTPERWACAGSGHAGADALKDTVADAMDARQSMASYFWGHGMCARHSPAECICTGARIGMCMFLSSAESLGR